jgi:glutamyl-tRNA reductase
MQLMVIGLNHKTAPVEMREKFNFSRVKIKTLLRRLRGSDYLSEVVLLSTCNRTEIYVVLDSPEEGSNFLKRLAKHVAGTQYESKYFYNLTGVNCVRHLFRVASSLDSLIVGEGQILSQIKDAYAVAKEQGMTSTLLNTIFQRAIAVGKAVRTKTKIAFNSVSVSSAAVDLALEVLGDITKAKVLVIGAGHMGELTTRHLLDKGAHSIFVANRNYEHAVLLAAKFDGEAVRFKTLFEQMVDADIVITSTGATHYIIKADKMRLALERRTKQTPIMLIDIAVPRDVEPEVGDLPGVELHNIDDLENVVDLNKNLRAREATEAEQLIEAAIVELKESLRYLSMRPVMVTLGEKMEFLRQRVLKRSFVKMPELTEEERRRIEGLTVRLMHKFLREPMIAMNSVAGTPSEAKYKDFISKLFLLDMNREDELGDENKYDYWD